MLHQFMLAVCFDDESKMLAVSIQPQTVTSAATATPAGEPAKVKTRSQRKAMRESGGIIKPARAAKAAQAPEAAPEAAQAPEAAPEAAQAPEAAPVLPPALVGPPRQRKPAHARGRA